MTVIIIIVLPLLLHLLLPRPLLPLHHLLSLLPLLLPLLRHHHLLLQLLRWHYSPMRTFASLPDLSQSAPFFDLSIQFVISRSLTL